MRKNQFMEFYNFRHYQTNYFNEDSSLNKKYNSFIKSTDSITFILENH